MLVVERREADHVASDAKFALLGGRAVGEMTLEPVLRSPLRGDPPGSGASNHDSLLASTQGRRHQWPDVIGTKVSGDKASSSSSILEVLWPDKLMHMKT